MKKKPQPKLTLYEIYEDFFVQTAELFAKSAAPIFESTGWGWAPALSDEERGINTMHIPDETEIQNHVILEFQRISEEIESAIAFNHSEHAAGHICIRADRNQDGQDNPLAWEFKLFIEPITSINVFNLVKA